MPPHNDSDTELVIETFGKARVLTLNRPHRRNAFTADLMTKFLIALDEAGTDPDVGVIVVTGSGTEAFCAGYDLQSAKETGSQPRNPMSGLQRNPFEVLLETWKPTIAAVNGVAAGGGLELALACDIRVCDPGARFILPEAKRGLGAAFATVMLPRLVPATHAFELLYLGDPIDAVRAHQIGLVSHIAESGTVLDHALAMASRISGNAPITLRRMKETMVKSSGLPLSAAMRLNEGVSPYESDDRVEGFRAFLEKRQPRWKGR